MDLLARLQNKNILLVDDDEWIRDSMGAFFDSEGCFFKAVESAEEGIDSLREKKYDIIIADFRLPGMDGLVFFDHIRRSHAAPLKILITAHGDQTLAEKSVAAGVDDYIAKPFQMQDIETSITRLMNGKRG
jgi:two-component system C4-dicarboxylate transport response regulator DctD